MNWKQLNDIEWTLGSGHFLSGLGTYHQCDQKKIAKCLQIYPSMISLAKWKISTCLQKLPKNVGDLNKLIVAKGFKNSPKVQ